MKQKSKIKLYQIKLIGPNFKFNKTVIVFKSYSRVCRCSSQVYFMYNFIESFCMHYCKYRQLLHEQLNIETLDTIEINNLFMQLTTSRSSVTLFTSTFVTLEQHQSFHTTFMDLWSCYYSQTYKIGLENDLLI